MNIKEILWPETCPFCGKASREGVCSSCKRKTEALIVKEPRCMSCGKPVRYMEKEYCLDCAGTRHNYDRGVGLWLHKEPVSTSIYQFKYHNQRCYASFYASRITAEYETLIRKWAPEVIIPVPLHPRRRRERGYNQAELLAKETGRILGIPVSCRMVRRTHNTMPQKKLGSRGRRKNLEHAFAAGRLERGIKSVLVMDDIYTTGATIDAVAGVLKNAGVQKVYFLTISIGQGYS